MVDQSSVIDTTVLEVNFPSLDETIKSVKPDLICSETFVNDHPSSTSEVSFKLTKTYSDTATLRFKVSRMHGHVLQY